MNIVIIVSCISNGGAERAASLLANNLIKNGHQVHLIAAVRDEISYEIDNRIDYLAVKQIKPITLTRIMQISTYVRKIKPDLAISFLIREGLGAIINGIPTISSLRFDPFSEYGNSQKRWMSFVFKRSVKVVYQTNMAKEQYGDLICDNGCVIANPIKNNLPRWKGPDKSNVFIAAGRLQPVKNYPMLIKAFVQFHKENSQFLLHIYGQGPEEQKLIKLIDDLDAAGYVKLKGYTNNIHNIMSESCVFCQTSNHEGLSNSMLEAMEIGIPVICTDCLIGGPREYITDKESGQLIPVGDEMALVEAMKYYVRGCCDLDFISNNERKAVRGLKENIICNQWEQMLKDICSN